MSSERPERKPTSNSAKDRRSRRILWLVSVGALILALIAILLSQCTIRPSTQAVSSPTPCPVPSIGATGANGLSAYELWKAVGNAGTIQEFLDSLVGEPGSSGDTAVVAFVGNDGQTGPSGEQGPSAYQLWLDEGNVGTPDDFIDSLIGEEGADGIAGPEGPSAYDVWVLTGGEGSEFDFLRSLVGEAGEPGANGSDGLSAYDVWVAEGGIGDETYFLSTLVGPAGADGVDGADGECTVGETGASGQTGATGADGLPGANGSDGLSAYDLWVLAGNPGSVDEFLASLVGSDGSNGAAGPIGPQGPAGTGGLGDVGSFFDVTTQGWESSPVVSRQVNTAFPVYLSDADPAVTDGVSVVHGDGDVNTHKSYVTFTRPGIYNIAFSAQIARTQGGSTALTSFWLRKNGVNVPASNTDVTLQAGAGKLVAAWNFFVPVTCATVANVTTCDQYQLMWSYDSQYINLWYDAGQSSPARPATPSVILTVNQVQ